MIKRISVLLILISSITFAQSAGSSGLSFLKIGFGPRNLAMSDLGVVSANDVTALYYNPALLSEYKAPQIMFNHNQWIQDTKTEMFGSTFKLFNLPFALGFNTTSISDFEVRSKPGPAESTFDINYFNISLSTGFKFYKDFSIGFTVKYLYESIFSDEATGFGFDIGGYYKNVIENLDAGISIRNLGSMNELRNEKTKLPTDLRVGLGYNIALENIESNLKIVSGIQKYTATDDTHVHMGGELSYKEFLALRAGYMTGYDSKGITAGMGIVWKVFNLDYSFIPFEYGLGNSHSIALMYNF